MHHSNLLVRENTVTMVNTINKLKTSGSLVDDENTSLQNR